MKQITFFIGKRRKKLVFDPKYAKELEDGWEIVVIDRKKPDVGIKHYIPRKDIIDFEDYKRPKVSKKHKYTNPLTGF